MLMFGLFIAFNVVPHDVLDTKRFHGVCDDGCRLVFPLFTLSTGFRGYRKRRRKVKRRVCSVPGGSKCI